MDSTINHRIKQLRKHCKLNQDDFGKRIGLKHGAISKMEKPGNTVIDQNIRLICDTFNVSEDWLRTGEGEMFAETNETILAELAAEYHLEGERYTLIRNFLMLTDEQQEAITRAMLIVAEANKKAAAEAAQKGDTAAAEGNAEPPAENVSDVDAPEDLPEDPEIEAEVAKYRAKMYARKKARMSLTSPSTEPFDENKKDPPR